MRVRRVIAAALVSAAALSGLAACTGDDKGSQPTTLPTVTGSASTSSSSASSSSAPIAEETIVSQWKGYFSSLLDLQTADENTISITLGQFAQPSQVNTSLAVLLDQKAKGYTQTGGVSFGSTAVQIAGEKATITECRNLSDMVVTDAAGQIVLKSPPSVTYVGMFTNVQGQKWLIDSVRTSSGDCG